MQARGPSSITCDPLFVCFFFFLIITCQTSLTFLFTSTKINKQIIRRRRKKQVECCFVLMVFPNTTSGSAKDPRKSTSSTIYQIKPCRNLTIKPKSLQPLSTIDATKLPIKREKLRCSLLSSGPYGWVSITLGTYKDYL